MVDHVCMKCGHRKMERDSNPGGYKEPTNQELIEAAVILACWGRLQEMERLRESPLVHKVSDDALADYGKLKLWWNDLGAENRNMVKRAAAQYSAMLEMH